MVIKYQGTMMKNPPREVNFKNMLMDRVKFVAQKPKKAKLKKNIGYENIEYIFFKHATLHVSYL